MATISGEVRDDAGDLVADVVVRAYRRDTGALLVDGLSGDGSEEVPGDADYASVSLLLHCDGTDGGTTFTDNSQTPKTITVVNNAHVETDQSKFGGASGYFDGNGDYLTTPASADWNFGTGSFTIEAWVYLSAFSGTDGPVFNMRYDGSTSPTPIVLGVTAAGKVYLWWSASLLIGGTTLSLNQWYHIAAARSGTSLKLFLDGVVDATVTDSAAHGDSTRRLSIGGEPGTSQYFNGYIDDLRVTKGVARYTANFTPPTAPFPDAATIPAKPLGEYTLTTSYTDEVQVIALDQSGGTTFNDLILRTTPV